MTVQSNSGQPIPMAGRREQWGRAGKFACDIFGMAQMSAGGARDGFPVADINS